MRCAPIVLATALALVPGVVQADRAALTGAIGTGPEIASIPAPYTLRGSPALTSFQLGVWGEARYALLNWLELEVGVLFEVPTTYWHSGVDVVTRTCTGTTCPGTLRSSMWGLSPHVGARLVFNNVWRPVVAVDVGLSARRWGGFQAIDPERHDYLLGDELVDFWSLQVLGAVGVGIEWVPWTPRAIEHLSVSIVPRFQVRLGSEPASWAVIVPVTVGWAWYR
jgi:hypothetical protein